MDSRFDIVIIGSGLGSLECGLILSKEGYKVCILEQANILGGCLQSFSRKGSVIDTGIHYIGSMDEGKIMRQYFKYFGIYDDLSLQRLDDEFDIIYPGSDSTNSYSYMHGYENFKSYMISHFPGEKNGINIYCDKIKEIGDSINVSVHQSGKFTSGSMEYLSVSASEFIDQCVSDKTLRSVLAGTNVLYGGVKESSNLYHHAMINHSNIEGSYRFIGGTQKVADLFIGKIKENGGEVYNNAKVINIIADGDEVKYVQLADGRRVSGKGFISGIHPALTFNMLSHTPVIKKAYKTRLNYLPNTYGLFSVYMLMPPCEFNYINHNQYFFRNNNVWDSVISSSDKNVKSVMLSTQQSVTDKKYSDVVTLMSPVSSSLFSQWSESSLGRRGEGYESLKKDLASQIIDFSSCFNPDIRNAKCIYTASPLTYQHYTQTPAGSAYGFIKDYKSAMASLLPSKTKMKNLFLTGQNLNVHGALGVTLSAASTCAEFIGEQYLSKKIGNI